jgi:hypothetical protein
MSESTDSEMRPMEIHCIPTILTISPSTTVGGSGSLSCSVGIDSLPIGGCSVNVGCDHTSILNPPSGLTWPFAVSFPAGGGTTANFTLTSNTVSTSTVVTVGVCESDENAGNPSNWQETAKVTVTP